MANTEKFKIGDDNWATKKGEVLGLIQLDGEVAPKILKVVRGGEATMIGPDRSIVTVQEHEPSLVTLGGQTYMMREEGSFNSVGNTDTGSYGGEVPGIRLVNSPADDLTATALTPTIEGCRFEYTIPPGAYSTGDILVYSWYRKRIGVPLITDLVGDLQFNWGVNVNYLEVSEIETDIKGFDRFQVTVKILSGTSQSKVSGNYGKVVGVGNESVVYWGHQLEHKPTATSLIRSTSGATSREDEVLTIVSNSFNSAHMVRETRPDGSVEEFLYSYPSHVVRGSFTKIEGFDIEGETVGTVSTNIQRIAEDGGTSTELEARTLADALEQEPYMASEGVLWVPSGVKENVAYGLTGDFSYSYPSGFSTPSVKELDGKAVLELYPQTYIEITDITTIDETEGVFEFQGYPEENYFSSVSMSDGTTQNRLRVDITSTQVRTRLSSALGSQDIVIGPRDDSKEYRIEVQYGVGGKVRAKRNKVLTASEVQTITLDPISRIGGDSGNGSYENYRGDLSKVAWKLPSRFVSLATTWEEILAETKYTER